MLYFVSMLKNRIHVPYTVPLLHKTSHFSGAAPPVVGGRKSWVPTIPPPVPSPFQVWKEIVMHSGSGDGKQVLKIYQKAFTPLWQKGKAMNSIFLPVFWVFQYIPCYLIQNNFGGFLGNRNSRLASLCSLWFLTNSHLFCNFNTHLSQKRFTAHLRFKGGSTRAAEMFHISICKEKANGKTHGTYEDC